MMQSLAIAVSVRGLWGLSALIDVAGGESTDVLQINGLGGDDSVNVTQTATAPIGVHVDLGAG
jgi:hypothetical protein